MTSSASPSAAPAPSAPRPKWTRRTFASFAVPNYRWFFVGQGTSLTGSWVRSAAQGWLVYLLTGSELMLGTVAACSQLPLVLSPLAGTIADRLDKRRFLMGLALTAMAFSLALAALCWTGVVQPWHIVVVAALAGVEMAFELPTRQSYVVEMVGREHLHNAIALNSAMFNSARMIGPAVAGLLMGAFIADGAPEGSEAARAASLRGIGLCFLVDGLTFLAVIYALGRIRTARLATAHEGGWVERLAAGFRYVSDDRRARVILTLLAVAVVFGWSYIALMAAFAKEVLHLGERGYGLLMSCNGLGACAGALWVAGRPEATSRRVVRRRVFGALWLFGTMVIVFSQMLDPYLAGAALALAGFGAIAFVSTSNTLIQLAVPDHLRGRVMGIWALVFGASMPTGSWLVGLLAELTDARVAIGISGVLCLLLSGLVWLRLPPPSDEPVHPTGAFGPE